MIIADVNVAEISANIQQPIGTGREASVSPAWVDSWQRAAERALDEIEQELADRYMELPLDADGVPIHVGDVLIGSTVSGKKKKRYARGIGLGTVLYDTDETDEVGEILNPCMVCHAKPRTVEGAVRDFVNSVVTFKGSRDGIPIVGIDDSLWRDYFDAFADEIRELMEVGE